MQTISNQAPVDYKEMLAEQTGSAGICCQSVRIKGRVLSLDQTCSPQHMGRVSEGLPEMQLTLVLSGPAAQTQLLPWLTKYFLTAASPKTDLHVIYISH